ncbi:MAG: hypothetical protein WC592_00220 [Candidatus Omnitrophota bacterium]|nr:hypothetical protein [Candidatus Omnitrophota bacterium]
MEKIILRIVARDALIFIFSFIFWILFGLAFAGDNAWAVIVFLPAPTYLMIRLVILLFSPPRKKDP